MEAATEKVFLDSHGVQVTNARFIANKQTYAMASVNSVKVRSTDQTPPKSGAVVLCVIGAFGFLVGLGNIGELGFAALIGLGALICGAMWYRSIKPKFEHKLILTTSSGEATALKSHDEPAIRRVETALNDAIIFRG